MASRKTIQLRFNAAGQPITPAGRPPGPEEWPVLELGQSVTVECSWFDVRLTDGQYQLTPLKFEEALPLQLIGYAAHTGKTVFLARSVDGKVTVTGGRGGEDAREFRRDAAIRADVSTHTIAFAEALRDERTPEFHVFVLGYAGGSGVPGVLGSCRFRGCDRTELSPAALSESPADTISRTFAEARSRTTPTTYYAAGLDDSWLALSSGGGDSRFFRRRTLSGPGSNPVAIPQQGFQVDVFGLKAERSTLAPNPVAGACYFATDEERYYWFFNGVWSEGVSLRGDAAAADSREYRQLTFAPEIDDPQYGQIIQMDTQIREVSCLSELAGAETVKIRVVSANPAVSGNAALQLTIGEVSTGTQIVPVTAAGTWQTLQLPEGGRNGLLSLRRLTDDSTDTLRSGETVSLLITDIAVTASSLLRWPLRRRMFHPILDVSAPGLPLWTALLRPNTPGAPWPAATPRNFATEPATWRDLGVLQQQIGDNDNASFYIDFDWHYDGAPAATASILSGNGNSLRFGVLAGASGLVTVFSNMFGSGSIYAYIDLRGSGNPLTRGRHVIQCRVSGTTFYARLDAETEKSVSGTRTSGRSFVAPMSNADMYIYNVRICNDTTGKTVWSYPAAAEAARLITLENIRTDRGCFEMAQPGILRRAKTALDLRGNSTSKTFVCRCYIPSHVPDGKLYLSGLITQGSYNGGYTVFVFSFSLWEDYRTTSYGIRLYTQFAGVSSAKGLVTDVSGLNIFDRWITFATVINYDESKISAYLDGVKIGESTVAMEPFGLGAASPASDAVSLLHDTDVTRVSGHKIAWAQVHNGALSAAQLCALA